LYKIGLAFIFILQISGDKNRSGAPHTKEFCEKKKPKSTNFEETFLKLPYLDNRFYQIKYIRILKISTFLSELLPNFTNSSCG
jgi:hypothetical protein